METGTLGNGGNITIDSGSFSLQDSAQLTASTLGQGNAGNVNVNVTSAVAKSSFTITGRGGLPPNPSEALSADAVQVDLVSLKPEVGKPSTPAVSTNPISPIPARIVEATGWAIAANSDIILTSSAPTLTPHSSWQRTADCRALNQHHGG
ncbi:hypothetical protein [Nostoc sp.]|uniref:hypothetical protein n=1 Tax=Nostoc sp. TaxID=1180 RepID=UPI002FF50C97